LASYDDLAKFLKSMWSTKKGSGMLLEQFNQIKKKENEIVKEFDTRFDKRYDHILSGLRPPTTTIRLLYMNDFKGKFGLILKDKVPDTLAKAKEYNA
jgi:hypothetical protein